MEESTKDEIAVVSIIQSRKTVEFVIRTVCLFLHSDVLGPNANSGEKKRGGGGGARLEIHCTWSAVLQ